MTPASPRVLRRLASLLLRGPEAPYVLADLEDAFDRDVDRGVPLGRARVRFLINIVLSASSVAGARIRKSSIRLSWVDVKLGLRMLVKYPALTTVSLFALAVGLPVSLGPMHFAGAIEGRLPEDPAGRIQVLRYWGAHTTVDDLARWRESLTSFDALAGVRMSVYNVDVDGSATPVSGSELTASAFDILGVRPELGRTFSPGDEIAGAPPVAVIGHDLWRTRFAAVRDVTHRTLRIGDVEHAIIGVMPEGFYFPRRDQIWLPVRDRVAANGTGQPLTIVGHLADGVSPDEAQVEFTSVGAAGAVPPEDGVSRLIPEVVPTSYLTFGFPKGGLRATPDYFIAQVLTLVPLLIACVNVGLLILARTATRTSEFAVRTALGASRGRILTQVFTESLVLSMVATGAGLLILGWLPERALTLAGVTLPYWIHTGLTGATVLRAFALGSLAAALAGVIPVLRSTGGAVNRTIQSAQAQRSGVRFGGLASVLIVTDVAVAVVAIGFAAAIGDRAVSTMGNDASDGLHAAQYLAFDLRRPAGVRDGTGGDEHTVQTKMAVTQQALVDRLAAEPGVRAVAVASALPRMDHEMTRVELEDGGGALSTVRRAMVDAGFFTALRHPILVGRPFDTSDVRTGAQTVIVNTMFVQNVLHGANAIGQRLRFRSWDADRPPSPWYEIVGVVGHLGMHSLNPEQDEGVYQPLVPGAVQPVHVALEVGDDPMGFAPRLRAIAWDVDAHAVVSAIGPLDQRVEGDWYILAAAVAGGLVLIGVLLTLAASGLYAIMSVTVAQRTREIGIRVALGADRTTVVLQVARRAMVQIAIGVTLGMIVTSRVFFELQRDANPEGSALLAGFLSILPGLAILALVGLAACAAPTLRALRISPIEALRGDG